MKIDGGCHCGQLRYEAEIDPDRISICHCTDCQAMSGTAFTTVTQIPRSKFKMISGTPKTYAKVAESGNFRIMAFCNNCGVNIFGTGSSDSTPISVRLGTCNQREEIKPKIEGWRRSALPWLGDLGTSEIHQKGPGLREIVQAETAGL